MNLIILFFTDVFFLFLEMAPYLILGMSIAGILSVTIDASLISHHIGRASLGSILKASLFGVPLPLCSCSVIPTSVYLEDSGASRPAVTAFLISTPQTGVDSITATYGMMGPLMAIYRPLSAFLLGVIGGLINRFFGGRPEHTLETPHEHDHDCSCEDSCSTHGSCGCSHADHENQEVSFFGRLRQAFHYSFIEFIDDIGLHFIIGLLIAGLMGIIIPDGFFENSAIGSGFTGMITMVIVGIPLYICSTSSIPIAVMLIAKGASLGTAFVFLLAGPATNITTFTVLAKRMGRRYTIQYVLILIFGALAFGLLLDGLLILFPGLTDFVPVMKTMEGESSVGIISILSSIVLLFLLIVSFVKRVIGKGHVHHDPENHAH